MKRNRAGFTLIELILYYVLLLVVLVLTLQWAYACNKNWAHHNKRSIGYNCTCAAHDYMIRDIQSAPHSLNEWKVCEKNRAIWSIGNCDIGWELKQNDLIRIKGIYDTHTKSWRKATKNLVAQNIYSIDIHRNRGMISTQLVSDFYNEQRTVALTNGAPA